MGGWLVAAPYYILKLYEEGNKMGKKVLLLTREQFKSRGHVEKVLKDAKEIIYLDSFSCVRESIYIKYSVERWNKDYGSFKL